MSLNETETPCLFISALFWGQVPGNLEYRSARSSVHRLSILASATEVLVTFFQVLKLTEPKNQNILLAAKQHKFSIYSSM